MPREPGPVQFEYSPVPTNNSVWLDKEQHILPSTPEVPHYHPKQAVRFFKSRLRAPFAQDCKLLPKRHIFEDEIPARAKESVVEISRSLRGNIPSVLHEGGQFDRTVYLSDLKAIRYFGDAQDLLVELHCRFELNFPAKERVLGGTLSSP
jgi:hypothetical protein